MIASFLQPLHDVKVIAFNRNLVYLESKNRARHLMTYTTSPPLSPPQSFEVETATN